MRELRLPELPDLPGSLFALTDDPRDMPNMYLNVGSRPGDHNGGETVEVHLTLRALQDGARLESDFRPGWCAWLAASDSCGRRLA
jgi:hypothetical protein